MPIKSGKLIIGLLSASDVRLYDLSRTRQMKSLRAASAALLVGLVGCAQDPVKLGYEAYSRGDCATALKEWLPKAKENEPAAENNIGVLWMKGCPQVKLPRNPGQAYSWYSRSAKHGYPLAYQNLGFLYLNGVGVEKDQTKAIANFHYAARWGLSKSVAELKALNVPIPPADLLAAASRKKKEDSEAALMLALLVLNGAIEGYNEAHSNAYTTGAPTPYATGSVPTQVLSYRGCTSDFDCGTGKVCAKPLYQSSGVCLQAVNSYGTPQFPTPSSSSVGVRTQPSCQFDTQCPIGFRCDFNLKMCVK